MNSPQSVVGTIRESVSLLESQGVGQLAARLAMLDRLLARVRVEVQTAWTLPAGVYRERRLSEICGYWQGLWSALRVHLEAGEQDAALELLERAIARVEPWPAASSNAEAAEVRGGRRG